MIVTADEIKQQYNFVDNSNAYSNTYYCTCGNVFKKNKTSLDNNIEHFEDDYDFGEFTEIIKQISVGDENIICNNCKKNLASTNNIKRTFKINEYFAQEYECINYDNSLLISCFKLKMELNGNKALILKRKDKYIKYDKANNMLFFKDYNDDNEQKFELDEIIKFVKNIFKEDFKLIYGLFNIHTYISELSKHVSDIKNIDIINGLLSNLRGTSNNAGMDIFTKIVSIFLGIIDYSNLSTIALTKDSNFLYDLMVECDIPKRSVLSNNKLTSPIKIFNFLVKNYINKINSEINEDNIEKHDFLYKSKQLKNAEQKTLKIQFKNTDNYKRKVVGDFQTGNYEVMEISNDATASKLIYKSIKSFSDYKQILKFFKFYNKHEIIDLLQKYDFDLLSKVIDLIYFRDRMEIKELKRVLVILKDYAKTKTLEVKPVFNTENLKIQYSTVKMFDFTLYDDCIMMMEVLKFNPKRHFTKIKTYTDLKNYHDNLVKYFNVVTDNEKNNEFKKFVSRFKYLENRSDYNGPLEIKLIDTPAMLITEGVQMKHSASSYSKKVIGGTYLIGQVFDKSKDLDDNDLKRFTIGFNFHEINGLEFHQVKGIQNKQGSNRFKKLLMEYLKAKDISFKPLKDLKLKNENWICFIIKKIVYL